MAAKTGSNTKIGLNFASAIDSVVAAGAGHQVECESFDHNKNQERTALGAIGSGLAMEKHSFKGAARPTASMEVNVKNDGTSLALIPWFAQDERAPVLVTSGVYEHSVIPQLQSINCFGNLAIQADTTDVYEYINGVLSNLSVNITPNQPLKISAAPQFGAVRVDGTTNTVSTLNSATEPASVKVLVSRPDTYVRINAQAGGALASGDVIPVTNVTVEYTLPREFVEEMKGSAGFSAPRLTDILGAMVTFTIKEQSEAGFAFIRAHTADTEYKMDIIVQGALISGSHYNEARFYFPRLLVESDPQSPVTSAAINPRTVTLKAFAADANPTGMVSVLPHFVIKNPRATKLTV